MRSARWMSLLEVSLWVGGVLIYMWFFKRTPFWRDVWRACLLAYLVVSFVRRKPLWEDLGWRVDNMGAALRPLVPLILLMAGLQVVNGWVLGQSAFRVEMMVYMIGYLPWALLQQVLLQSYVCLRLWEGWRDEWFAVTWTTFFFAVAHLPNPYLVAATALLGFITALHFCRYRNVLVLAFVHALFATLVVHTLPADIYGRLRVGRGYLEWWRTSGVTHVQSPPRGRSSSLPR